MDASPPTLAQPDYKDRRTGLIICGIIAILIGACCALFVPVALFGQAMVARQTQADFDSSAAVLCVGVYGLLAVVMVWLGVGSIQCRRWARAILLCLGWIGLIGGLIAMPIAYLSLGSLDEAMRASGQTVPPGMIAAIKGFTMAITFVIYIVIPGIAVLVYRSPHVKRTCEARDPVERWTDRCPLPVLALVILLGLGVPIMPLFILASGKVFPLLGFVATGWTARLLWLGLTAFMAYSAWGLYRLRSRAWWIYTGGTALLAVSWMVTLQRVGLLDLYRQMGMPEAQLELMAKSPLLSSDLLFWMGLLSAGVWLGYLIYIRRYFAPVTNRPLVA